MDELGMPVIKPPSLDLQTHIAELEALGLLVRIDRPINKDTSCILWCAASSWAASRRTSAGRSCLRTSRIRVAAAIISRSLWVPMRRLRGFTRSKWDVPSPRSAQIG
jgi:hypothetical protein